MRRVRTASGAVAVQLVVKDRGEVVDIEHIGSAHTDAELALLLAAARDRLQPGQQALEFGELVLQGQKPGQRKERVGFPARQRPADQVNVPVVLTGLRPSPTSRVVVGLGWAGSGRRGDRDRSARSGV